MGDAKDRFGGGRRRGHQQQRVRHSGPFGRSRVLQPPVGDGALLGVLVKVNGNLCGAKHLHFGEQSFLMM